MELDAILISRVNFTFFDALSDIGGIQSVLGSFFSILLVALNHEHLENYMASRLYKLKKVDGHDRTKYKRHFDRSDFFQPTKFANLLNYIVDILPARCVCCSKHRKRLGMEQARAALAKEIDIIELIKQRRFFQKAFRLLMSKQERIHLKEHSRYFVIDPDLEEDDQYLAKLRLDSIARKQSHSLQDKSEQEDEQADFTDGFFSSSMPEQESRDRVSLGLDDEYVFEPNESSITLVHNEGISHRDRKSPTSGMQLQQVSHRLR